MTAKRHQIFIGTGLVAALSCGLAPLPAVASTIPDSSVRVAASDINAVADLTLAQTVTPSLKPGQAGDATVRVTNNSASDTARGAKFQVTAPAGTTFTKSSLTYTYPSGWATTTNGTLSADKKTLTVTFGADAGMTLAKNGEYVDIKASIQSDSNNTRAGVIADGKLAVVEGPAFPVGTNVALGYTADYASLTLAQTVTPKLKPGQAGDATVRVTNNAATNTPRGAKFVVTAPAGTTFTESSLTYTYPTTGWGTTTAGTLSADKKTLTVTFGADAGMALDKNGGYVDITARILSDANNTRSGLFADGKLAVVQGPAFPVGTNVAFGYTADHEAFTLAQTVTPKLKPGQTGDSTVRVTGNGPSATTGGSTFVLTAPAGTTFSKAQVSYKYSDDFTSWMTATLSADKKTLTVPFASGLGGNGAWVEFTSSIQSDANNTRSGLYSDGKFIVTEGSTFPVGLTAALGYTADHEAFTLAQTVSPKLKPGQAGDATIKVTNNGASGTGSGTVVKFTAPAGTTFNAGTVKISYASGESDVEGVLSADKKTLTLTAPGFALGSGQWNGFQVSIKADADSTRSGSINDGAVLFTSGALSGVTTAFGYTAEQSAKPVILDAPAFDASVIDTNRPVFSGTGQPGAEITVKGVTRVIATTTVKADGTWSVPASFDLANGGYAGTVTQSSDGSSASFKFGIKFGIPVTLTAPAQEATLQPGKPVFSGKGQPGASVEVRGQFGTLLGTTTVGADGNWSVESLVALGVADYRGTAVQKSSQDTTSASFQFSVKKDEVEVTPVVLTSPAIDAELEAGKPVFAGTGHPGATVMVQGAYGTVLGTTVVETDGSWSVESTVSLVAGAYSGSAKQTVEGKQSASPFKFTAK